ncbi:MAG: pentapeptide repeat-containing protein [Parachlamydiaceae bacterium]|nr:MAG: pentapeptide repeat-containing protein [Parachlamydiaceae bacterium]
MLVLNFINVRKIFLSLFQRQFFTILQFFSLRHEKTSFQGSKMKECHFNETNLMNADFRNADLSKSLFHQCDLSKANFSDAKHYLIDARTNKIKRQNLLFLMP